MSRTTSVRPPGRRLRARALRAARQRPAPHPEALLLELARDVPHDLKSPLRTLRNYAVFLSDDYADRLDPAGRELLAGLVEASARMEGRVNALARYAQICCGELADEAVDLQRALTEVRIGLGLPRAPGPTLVVPRPLPVVRGDRARLREVLDELLRNAVTYTERPSPRVEVVYTPPEAPGGPARIHVRDDGIGVPPPHREAVFHLFRRLHRRDAYGGGVGAGLTFARRIAERHGGRLWLEGAPGGGTTAVLTLPNVL